MHFSRRKKNPIFVSGQVSCFDALTVQFFSLLLCNCVVVLTLVVLNILAMHTTTTSSACVEGARKLLQHDMDLFPGTLFF